MGGSITAISILMPTIVSGILVGSLYGGQEKGLAS